MGTVTSLADYKARKQAEVDPLGRGKTWNYDFHLSKEKEAGILSSPEEIERRLQHLTLRMEELQYMLHTGATVQLREKAVVDSIPVREEIYRLIEQLKS